MTRVVSLFLPTWPTGLREGSRRRAPPREALLVLIGHDGKARPQLRRRSSPAAVTHTMTAQVVIPDLIVRRDPEADNEALERLALWMLQRYATTLLLIRLMGSIGVDRADHYLLPGLLRYRDKLIDEDLPNETPGKICCTYSAVRPASVLQIFQDAIQFRDELHRSRTYRARLFRLSIFVGHDHYGLSPIKCEETALLYDKPLGGS